MADWDKPDLNSTKTTLPGECRVLAISAAKLDYASDTNIPTGVIRYNRSTDVFEEYNGSIWTSFNVNNATSRLGARTSFSSVTVTPVGGGSPVWTPGSPHSGSYSIVGPYTFLDFDLNGTLSVATATVLEITTSPTLPGITRNFPIPVVVLEGGAYVPVLAQLSVASNKILVQKESGSFATGTERIFLAGHVIT